MTVHVSPYPFRFGPQKLVLIRECSRSVEWLKARKKGEKAARLVDRGAHFDQSFGESPNSSGEKRERGVIREFAIYQFFGGCKTYTW